jgi:hypothetical protein
MATHSQRAIGNVIAPPRFLLFIAATALALFVAIPALGLAHMGVMVGFDAGACAVPAVRAAAAPAPHGRHAPLSEPQRRQPAAAAVPHASR